MTEVLKMNKKKKNKWIVRSDDYMQKLACSYMDTKLAGGFVDNEDEMLRSRSQTGRTILHMLRNGFKEAIWMR